MKQHPFVKLVRRAFRKGTHTLEYKEAWKHAKENDLKAWARYSMFAWWDKDHYESLLENARNVCNYHKTDQ